MSSLRSSFAVFHPIPLQLTWLTEATVSVVLINADTSLAGVGATRILSVLTELAVVPRWAGALELVGCFVAWPAFPPIFARPRFTRVGSVFAYFSGEPWNGMIHLILIGNAPNIPSSW